MRTAFRLDICDPIVPADGVEPQAFSFEPTLRSRAPGSETEFDVVTKMAVASGFANWRDEWLVSEEGLRALSRAALTVADEMREQKQRIRDEEKIKKGG
jgi:hypothetical protein